MYVCVSNYSSHTTEPICIKIIPANRAFYADCYRLLWFKIFTKYDEFCPRERCTLHRRIFANGNVLRDVIVIISVTIRVFRNKPDWPTKKPEKPRQSEINLNTITNLNNFKIYTITVFQSVLVNFSAVNDFQFINIQCHLSWMSQKTQILQLVWKVFDSTVSLLCSAYFFRSCYTVAVLTVLRKNLYKLIHSLDRRWSPMDISVERCMLKWEENTNA